jgi:predicted dinucleotide-binding enzyme
LNRNSPRLFPGIGEDAAFTGWQITARRRNINAHCRYRPGNAGRGLAALWRKAGHEVTALAAAAGTPAAPVSSWRRYQAPTISAALGQVTGLAGKIAIDATSAFPCRNEAFASLAGEVKSFTGGPVAKSFNLNFAALYDQIAVQRVPPGSFYVAEDDARDITGQLITDAGYDPVPLGRLDKARAVEDLAWLLVAAMNDGVPVFYRFAVPGEL